MQVLVAERYDLSVIIPTRNRADVVGRAVHSVLAAGAANAEVIVVDDGSTDDTRGRIAAIGDRRVRYHRLEGDGSANRARNAGASLARSDLFAFLDSDDVFEEDRAARLIEFFAGRPEIDCLVDGFVETSRGLPRVHSVGLPPQSAAQIRRLLLMHLVPLTNSAITVRRKAFEAIGGYDEGLPRHQDRELLLRLAEGHAIWFGTHADVTKHRLRHSISHNHVGYVAGMDALAARCPDYDLPENRDIFRYLIVRGILKAASTGHWPAVVAELRAWHRASHLPKDYARSLMGYWRGRALRKAATERLSAG